MRKIKDEHIFIKTRFLVIRKKRDGWYIDTGQGCSKIKNKFGTLADAKKYAVKHDLHGCWWEYEDEYMPQKKTKNVVSLVSDGEGAYFDRKRGIAVWRDKKGDPWRIDTGEGCRSVVKKDFKTLEEVKKYVKRHNISGCLGGI